jgi:hypothetical protein
MERVAWTDERLDDLSAGMDAGFGRVDHDMRDLRSELRSGFADLRSEIDSLRALMLRMNAGLLIAVLAAFFLRGA